MKKQINYLKHNKDSWNKRTPIHLESEFYAMDDFKKGGISLNDIELEILGDIRGLSILHLQCHCQRADALEPQPRDGLP